MNKKTNRKTTNKNIVMCLNIAVLRTSFPKFVSSVTRKTFNKNVCR